MPTISGAEYLASIFGTEKDKVNCSFFFKIGACRHGDKCSRLHNKPTYSQTIIMHNFYRNPLLVNPPEENGRKARRAIEAENQRHFDEFFEEVFLELEEKYGEVIEINVCDNIGEHMIGNVYVKFRHEEAAMKAEKALNDRWFNGQPIYADLSPVTDFREACCRQYEMGGCSRGGFCNFMHLRPISYKLRRILYSRKSGSGQPTASRARPVSRDDDDYKEGDDVEDRRSWSSRSSHSTMSTNPRRSPSTTASIGRSSRNRSRSRSASQSSQSSESDSALCALPSAYNRIRQFSSSSSSDSDLAPLSDSSLEPESKRKKKGSKDPSKSPSLPRAFRKYTNSDEGSGDSYESESDDDRNYTKNIVKQNKMKRKCKKLM